MISLLLRDLKRLPAAVHSHLICTIATISTHATDELSRNAYFKQLGDAIQGFFVGLVSKKLFMQNYQLTRMRESIVNCFEMFDGLALAMDESNSTVIFEMCHVHFGSFTKLLDLYHNYADVQFYILLFFRDLLRNLVKQFLIRVRKQSQSSITRGLPM